MEEKEIEKLESTLAKLSEKEQRVLELRYGLQGDAPKTQKEVGEVLGMSESSIFRIERKAINRMKIIEKHNIHDDSQKEGLKELGNTRRSR